MNYFLVLTHQINPQLKKLLDVLNGNTYVHLCKNYKTVDKKILSNIPSNVKLIKKKFNGNWGGFGIVQATIEGLRQILNENEDCTHITLLSGTDYPIKPLSDYRSFLSSNADKSFLRHWPFFPFTEMENNPSHPWHVGAHIQKLRITKYYYNFFNTRYSIPLLENDTYFQFNFFRKFKHYIKTNAIGFTGKNDKEFTQLLFSFFLKFPRNIPLNCIYGGSQWFTIAKKHADYVVKYHDENKKNKKFFKHTMLPDETYIQTILLNSPFKNDILNNNLRFIVFESNQSHPKVLTYVDINEILKSEAFFARKFDPNTDSKILDLLDESIV